MEAITERTTKEDQRIAKSSVLKMHETAHSISTNESSIKIKLNEGDEFLPIPKKAFSLLVDILANMALGKSLTLIASDTEVGTQQAAEIINVSRPHMVKLLEAGEIPFKKVGTHRRVELKSLIAYKERLKEVRKGKLAFLTGQAQDLNLGY